MKIVRFYEYGGPEVLKVEDVPTPQPGPGEVRVRAEAIGVGVPDILVRTNTDAKVWSLPMIPGNDLAGTVDAVGEGVTRFKLGDRVLVASRELPQRGGCYVESRVVSEKVPFALPDSVWSEQAVALSNYLLAWFLLNRAGTPQPGQSVLVHAAAGGAGSALVQMARRADLTVFGVAGGPEKAEFVREMGAHAAIDRYAEDIPARVSELTDGKGVDVIYDGVAGPEFHRNFDMLAEMGLLVNFGYIAGQPDPAIYTPMAREFSRNLGFRIFSIHYFDKAHELRRAVTEEIIGLLAAGKITPRIHGHMELGDAAEAHRLLASGKIVGKLVLTP